MPYSLADKILAYFDENDIENARIQDGNIIIPLEIGEMHRRIDGVVTQQRLAAIVADYRAATKGDLSMSNKPQGPKPTEKPKPPFPPKPAGGQGGQRPV